MSVLPSCDSGDKEYVDNEVGEGEKEYRIRKDEQVKKRE